VLAEQIDLPLERRVADPHFSQAQVEELVEFMCASGENRRMSFQQLAQVMEFGVKEDAIRTAFLRGFHRRLAMRKPPISEKNRQHRLQ
jgi:hypothetical protein